MPNGHSRGRRSGVPRRPTARRRRGAVLVLTALTMTGLMAATALAVDLGRLYVLRAELQTAADAAALAAAVRLNGERQEAEPSARAAAAANRTLAGVVDVDAVRIGVWNAEARTFSGGASLDTADAAQVTVGRTTTYLFARLFTDGPVRLTARATAWAGAPAMETCVLPWFILHHDYMAALGKAHEDTLTFEDIRSLRNPARKRPITVRLNRKAMTAPEPGWFYGMILPAVGSGLPMESGPAAYREHIRDCTVMRRKWVAKTEQLTTTAEHTWPGLQEVCAQIRDDVCYNESGGVGVRVNVSIFCTGPEHKPPTMWFEVEWLTGLEITGGRQTGDFTEITGYLVAATGTGQIGETVGPTGIVRSILVQ